MARHFLDTNVLLYSISRDPAEARKREISQSLLDDDDCGLSVQILQEFYLQATRGTRADALPHGIAVGLISTWLRFEVQPITVSVLTTALDIANRFALSYWDSAVIAAADALGCSELHSEDMSHGQRVLGVTIVNPYR